MRKELLILTNPQKIITQLFKYATCPGLASKQLAVASEQHGAFGS